MNKILIIFLSIPFFSISQNSYNTKYVFSKMDNQDVYICQNESYSNINDSIIEIYKAPFKILFKSKKAQKKIDYSVYLSLFKEKIEKHDFKLGTKITDHCIFQSSKRLAQGPFANYLGISDNWCYKTEDEQMPLCCIGNGHHLFYYTDEDYRNMILSDSNDDILNLEYTVGYIYDNDGGKNINMTLLDTIYIVALQDFNLNNIIDEGELTISILKLIN
jgi:hypothetical protein